MLKGPGCHGCPAEHRGRIILDLCGGTGAWSQPYRDAGYEVQLVDLPQDVRLMRWKEQQVHGILAAPPCTTFSYARNRYPPTDDELRQGLSIVDACLRMVMLYKPKWWALENPRAKLRWFLGPARLEFYHWEFGDGLHKPTCIWGDFEMPKKTLGVRTKPSTWKTKRQNADPQDAITPAGFAQAFFAANP